MSVPGLALGAALLWWSGAAAPAGASAAGNGGLFTGSMGPKVFSSGETIVNLASEGLYNPSIYGWAVVFDWTTIDMPSDAVVRFTNHPSGAPVIWHATGDVLIEGAIVLDGERGHHYTESASFSRPGPGGFRGGRAAYQSVGASSAGLGPGGGFKSTQLGGGNYDNRGGAGSYGEQGGDNGLDMGPPGPLYGGASVFPLLGGSGGAAGSDQAGNWRPGGGGAGGGAILIASEARLELTSSAGIYARGGIGGDGAEVGHWQSLENHGGGGSGGAIRLVGDVVSIQDAELYATGGWSLGHQGFQAGAGRIRIEANASQVPENYDVIGTFVPPPSESIVVHEIVSPTPPSLQVVGFNTDPVGSPGSWTDISLITDPNDAMGGPQAQMSPPGFADVELPSSGVVALQILADHVAFGETVEVRVTRARGSASYFTSTPLVQTGAGTQSLAEVEVDFSEGVSAIQLRVDLDD